MALPLPQPLPKPLPGPDLRHATLSPPPPDPRHQHLSRGIVAIGLVAAFLLSYLCVLVRVSALDVRCYRLQADCDEIWAAIANDQTELSAQDDLATNLDVAAANGLQPVVAHEKVVVSADLIPVKPTEAELTDLDRVRERPSLAHLR